MLGHKVSAPRRVIARFETIGPHVDAYLVDVGCVVGKITMQADRVMFILFAEPIDVI